LSEKTKFALRFLLLRLTAEGGRLDDSQSMENIKTGSDVLFVLLGGIMVLARHAGFAFLELGTVRKKKALSELRVAPSAKPRRCWILGYYLKRKNGAGLRCLRPFLNMQFRQSQEKSGQCAGQDHYRFLHLDDRLFFHWLQRRVRGQLFLQCRGAGRKNGYDLVKFFFLLTFAAAIPAIVSGGIAERARFNPRLAATFVLVGFVYPFFEGMTWNGNFGVQAWLESTFGHGFHDFAGSVVVHAMGGWIALPAVLLLGARRGRYTRDGLISAHPPSNIPFLALGAWILTVGWFGFNVMSAQLIEAISGLVAVNSLMAMVGGTLAALVAGCNDPGFIHNGPLAGLVAVCAGSDLMHPLGVLATGAIAGAAFVWLFTLTQNKWKIDDVPRASSVPRRWAASVASA